mgnify:FL=1
MKVEEYRTEVSAMLTKLNERQISIFKALQRIDKHLEKLNGQTYDNERSILQMRTWGSALVFIVPIAVTIIMRLI